MEPFACKPDTVILERETLVLSHLCRKSLNINQHKVVAIGVVIDVENVLQAGCGSTALTTHH